MPTAVITTRFLKGSPGKPADYTEGRQRRKLATPTINLAIAL
jgi:hypothetical protein